MLCYFIVIERLWMHIVCLWWVMLIFTIGGVAKLCHLRRMIYSLTIRVEAHCLLVINTRVIPMTISERSRCRSENNKSNILTGVTLNKCNTAIVDKHITMECYCGGWGG